MSKKRATELEWLMWFAKHSDFGPAHGDVMDQMMNEFKKETGKNLPTGWNYDSEGEENDD